MIAALALPLALSACNSTTAKDPDFFTSGSREADQRAEHRMAQTDQLRGEKQEGGTPPKRTLYERLGGQEGVKIIVDDFVTRALADPRVNWRRTGIKYGGFLGMRKKSATWDANVNNVMRVKAHIAQFIAVASGGPAKYQGRSMKDAHRNMKIDNTEFDASVGDLKAALDNHHIGVEEQKELLAIIESVREQIVEVR